MLDKVVKVNVSERINFWAKKGRVPPLDADILDLGVCLDDGSLVYPCASWREDTWLNIRGKL
jgi:hypothetical protein